MKNQFRFLTTILFVTILFGCQKNELANSEIEQTETITSKTNELFGFSVEVRNGMLAFPTRDDYESALEYLGPQDVRGFAEWENTLGFISMRGSLEKAQREKLGVVDDLLATLINQDAQIEIAGNVFQLRALEETVSVVPTASFEASGLSAKNVSIFSTDDNILDILEGKESRLSKSERARYCSKRKLSWNYRYSNGTNKIHAKVVYQKAGFLNSLVTLIEEEIDLGGTSSWNMLLETNGRNFWTNKKYSNVTIPYHKSSIFNAARKTYRPYYSSRRLKSYRFSIAFKAQLKSSGQLFSKNITIDCY